MNNQKEISKILSYALRHKPEHLNLKIDDHGWTDIGTLLFNLSEKGHHLNFENLKTIVEENDKQRFSISEDSKRIRANQGHSIDVKLDLEERIPPYTLFHGTVEKFMTSIRENGLSKGNRHHVHLSDNIHTAETVGNRRGKAIVLKINAHKMHLDGYIFFQSENGVWLTESVPSKYFLN